MKAAVFYEPYKMVVEEVAKPTITDDEILVRIHVAAICGTDVRIFEGKKTKGIRRPSIIGHELVGTVEYVGENVQDFVAGDRVGIDPVIACGKCHYCQNRMENVCANRTAIGYEYDGGFAEFVKIPQIALQSGNIVKLPINITFEQAVIAEPLACCLTGLEKSPISVGDTVVVIGTGPIGLMHVQLAKAAGASKVIVSELIKERRNIALKLGADITVNPDNQSLADVVMEETGHLGADIVIMAIGIPALINPSLKLLRKGGYLNLFAGFTKGILSEVDPNIIHYNEVNIVGSSALTRANYAKALKLIASGQIKTDIITTVGYTLEDILRAIEDVKIGVGMKTLIHIN